MIVNGKNYPHHDGLTLHALLAEIGVNRRAVVVMRADEVYRAGSIPDCPLAEADVIEIVTMMQGG